MIEAVTPSKLWPTFHFPLLDYVVPVVVVASTLQNLFTIVTLFGMHRGIGRTTRALFMALAITDLLNLLIWYGTAAFANYGLRLLTSGTFYIRDLFQYEVFCKSLPALGYFGLFCSHWLYVLVNGDRLIAVLRPHRSQRVRIRKRLQLPICLLVFLGLLTAGLTALLNCVNQLAEPSGVLLIKAKLL